MNSAGATLPQSFSKFGGEHRYCTRFNNIYCNGQWASSFILKHTIDSLINLYDLIGDNDHQHDGLLEGYHKFRCECSRAGKRVHATGGVMVVSNLE
jgi:hypothetical protein